MSAYTECLANAFINEGTKLRAAVFYPGGNGLLETRLWNSGRNRPAELAREHPHIDQQWDYQEHKKQMEDRGVKVADLVELGHSVLDGAPRGEVHHPAEHRVERRPHDATRREDRPR